MTFETWLLFCSASLFIILIPGPLSLLMVTNSLNYGLLRSTPAFIGGVSASVILIIASATGLGALLLASEQLFSIARYAGASYLIYLGICAWREGRKPARAATEEKPQPPGFPPMFWRAFSLGISNPKDILFFVAFLPQFIDPQASLSQQLLIMVLSWCVLDLICKIGYGSSAKLIQVTLKTGQGMGLLNKLSGSLFISAGTAVFLKDS